MGSMAAPVIQVIDKADYKKQRLVSIPGELPPLAPSSVRVRSSLLSLTTNNITYCRLAHIANWWSTYSLPANIPKEYNDAEKYGRIASWGFGDIVESNVESVPVGTKFWGYMPIGTLPVDMPVTPFEGIKGQWINTDPARQVLMPVYNWYLTEPPSGAEDKESLGWDALVFVMFFTGYAINRFALACNEAEFCHPLGGDIGKIPSGSWSKEDANIDDAVVICLAGSGKTGLTFAQQLRAARPKSRQPRKVISLGSEGSAAFTETTGYYDDVLLYDDKTPETLKRIGIDQHTKVMLVDFGGRGNACSEWYEALEPAAKSVVMLGVGSTPTPGAVSDQAKMAAQGRVQANASGLRQFAIDTLGPDGYLESLKSAWRQLLKEGALPGVKLVFEDGMEAFSAAWDKLCAGEVSADKGLVFTV